MSYNLFLDDQRNPEMVKWVVIPNVEWVIVRTGRDFVRCIDERGVPTNISFDYWLADNATDWTGLHCANYLRSYCRFNSVRFPKWTVHSTAERAPELVAALNRLPVDIAPL